MFIFKRSKIAPLCISIETVKATFFESGVEIFQVLGVEVSTVVTIYLSITIITYTK
jgi:hypothetical protein